MAPPKGYIPWNKGVRTGQTPWNKGVPMSNEQKQKVSASRRGKGLGPRPPEVCQKISLSKCGKPLSQAHRDSISKVQTGRPRPNSRGEKNPNWKGGRRRLDKQIRATLEYNAWRRTVFERDGFQCQQCGVRGAELNADHIVRFGEILERNSVKTVNDALECEELWDVSNGRTLCVPCHRKTPTWGAGSRTQYGSKGQADHSDRLQSVDLSLDPESQLEHRIQGLEATHEDH